MDDSESSDDDGPRYNLMPKVRRRAQLDQL